MSGLGADVLTARWVMTAYLIATAVTMPTLGWVGRKLGNQRLYALGVTIFISASALCGAAPSIEVLILVRILQGVGAAVLMPISLALMLEVTPPRQRGLGTSPVGSRGLAGQPVWPAHCRVRRRRRGVAHGFLPEPGARQPRRFGCFAAGETLRAGG